MIPEFFENKEIFITGATGIFGKALTEKLLRSCNVRKIYMLLRQKKNETLEQRMEQFKNTVIFNQLKLKKPNELDNKLQYIPGDVTLPLLGISVEHQQLMANVSIVFHCAATVRFDEPITTAIKINVGGTLQMLKFAERLKNLEIVMHVSTFFSNPYLKRVEQKLYDSPMDWRLCLRLVEQKDVSEEVIDAISRKLIIGFPNTYCFTKNIAESLVNDHRHKLPVAICRPSVVFFALEEPIPGFASSLMGATGLFAVAGTGLVKVTYLKKDIVLDIAPQDLAIKILCYFTVKAANLYKEITKPIEVPVFLMSSCTHNNMSFSECNNIMEDYNLWTKVAFQKNFLIPGVHFTESRFVYLFFLIFKQLIPAILGDIVIFLSGREPGLLRAQRKVHTSMEVFTPFVFNAYESPGTSHFHEMVDKLKGTDFNMDAALNVKEFYSKFKSMNEALFFIREYLLKEDPKTLSRSRKILKLKIFAYNLIKILLALKIYKTVGSYFQHH